MTVNGEKAKTVFGQIGKGLVMAAIGSAATIAISAGEYKATVDDNEERSKANAVTIQIVDDAQTEMEKFVAAQIEINRNLVESMRDTKSLLREHIKVDDARDTEQRRRK